MKTQSLIPVLVTGTLLFTSVSGADTLIFRNGNRVEGTLASADGQTLRFNVSNHVNTYNRSEVESLQFSEAITATATHRANATASHTVTSGATSDSQNDADKRIPAGTEVTVRLIDAVDSEADRLGQTYRASVDQPVVVDGQTIIPRGADATATLIDAKNSGKIEGRTSLTLDLKSIVVDGQSYDIATSGVTQESGSRGARSAKVIGGTAALGAIIGAIAGGGKGAAIGAGSGAAVGTAAQVVTSGQKVKVPSETRLSFMLQNPLTIK